MDQVVTAGEYERTHDNGRVAAVFACEGGDHLEGDPSHVEEAYADGVRHIQPFHVASNPLVELGDDGRDAGLTAVGRDVVREMNRVGMVIDLGHASFTTARAATELSTAPIIQSHSLIRREGARGFGMTHDHARVIADTGGVIGAFGGTSNRDIPGYVDNVLYMTEVVGVDHVGLGSDMDGTGGRSVWDRYAQAPAIVAGLLQRGMSEDDVAKVIGGNALRVLREVAG